MFAEFFLQMKLIILNLTIVMDSPLHLMIVVMVAT